MQKRLDGTPLLGNNRFCAGAKPGTDLGHLGDGHSDAGIAKGDRLYVRLAHKVTGRLGLPQGAVAAAVGILCPTRWVSMAIDGGASWLMKTGCSVCDLNCQPLSSSKMHSLIRSATSIGGFDWGAGGRPEAP